MIIVVIFFIYLEISWCHSLHGPNNSNKMDLVNMILLWTSSLQPELHPGHNELYAPTEKISNFLRFSVSCQAAVYVNEGIYSYTHFVLVSGLHL